MTLSLTSILENAFAKLAKDSLNLIKEKEISVIVGLELSGRPVAYFLDAYLKRNGFSLDVFYIDPELLLEKVKPDATYFPECVCSADKNDLSRIKEQLELETPTLYTSLNSERNILVVDELVITEWGDKLSTIQSIFKLLGNKNTYSAVLIKDVFNSDHINIVGCTATGFYAPWYFDKKVIGYKKNNSLLTTPTPNKESEEFYEELRSLADKV